MTNRFPEFYDCQYMASPEELADPEFASWFSHAVSSVTRTVTHAVDQVVPGPLQHPVEQVIGAPEKILGAGQSLVSQTAEALKTPTGQMALKLVATTLATLFLGPAGLAIGAGVGLVGSALGGAKAPSGASAALLPDGSIDPYAPAAPAATGLKASDIPWVPIGIGAAGLVALVLLARSRRR